MLSLASDHFRLKLGAHLRMDADGLVDTVGARIKFRQCKAAESGPDQQSPSQQPGPRASRAGTNMHVFAVPSPQDEEQEAAMQSESPCFVSASFHSALL